MHQDKIMENWESRGYIFVIFKGSPGQVWADFIHRTDELVVLAEGDIEIEIEGKSQQPQIGEEVFIPANAIHTVRNIGKTNNVWYFGYKNKWEFNYLVLGSHFPYLTHQITTDSHISPTNSAPF